MSNHANVIVDYESAPVRPSGLPNHYAEGIASHAVDENEVPTHQSAGYLDEKKVDNGDQGTIVSAYQEAAEDEDYEGKPTAEELLTLRKVAAPMPWPAIAMCAIELSERASYYGCTQVFGNFVRGSLPIGGNGAGAVAPGELGLQQSAGALGKGSQVATAITTSFTFLAYCFPILGGIVSDSYWGRFKTVSVGTAVGGIAHVLLVIPAIPKILQTPNTAFGLFVPFVYFLSLAAGFIKPCLGPMLCDQSPVTRNEVIVLKSGERVILSPQVTVQRYLLIFYTCINIGAFFGLATSYAAHNVGFWLAFLAPGIFYMLMPIVLVICYRRLRKYPPQGTIVLEAFRATKSLFSNGNFRNLFKRGDAFWENAKPSNRIAAGESLVNVTWDDRFVDDLKRTFKSCAVFLLIPIFNLADGGLGNSENAMSASMTVNGVPNDLISNFNPLTIVIAAPIINYGLYPLFSKMGRPISPMWRMTIGFVLGGLNMIYGGVLQKKIYDLSPCGNQASTCPDPAPVSLWAQIPLYAVPAIGEIFINPTSYELAYTRAPPRMKGLVYSLCLFNQAISSAISLALSAVVVDPNLVIPYWVLGAACFVCAAIFPFFFKELDEEINFHDPSMQSTDESVQEKKALSS